jgi:drug/metabolite transporter (DMT)-like permease
MKFNRLRVAVGAICDVLASTMQCVALNFVAGSAYQMMRGGTVATTFVFTILYLRRKATKPQLIGSCLTIAGVLLVGVAGLIGSSSGPDEAGL